MAVTEEIQEQIEKKADGTTPNYEVDYNDQRFGKVESDKNQALTELEQTYGGMIDSTDQFYDKQIQASKDWADKQTQLQQEQTDFAIEQIEQQKEQANKDYLKEQSGAYVDWQKQSNKYGANAERMASQGLTGTGYSESSQVSMYNTYQLRVASAKESIDRAFLNFNNAIKDARLQNNAALAEIALEAHQKQLELSLAGFQYKNQLILDQANKKTELDSVYWNRYQDVLQQINTENAMKEDIRQFNETMAEDIRQFDETMAWNTEQAELNREHDITMLDLQNQYQMARDEANRAFQAAQAEFERAHAISMLDLENQYQTARDEANRAFQMAQAEYERAHEFAIIEANTAAAKEKADHEYALAMAELEMQHQNAMEKLYVQLENEKDLLGFKNGLAASDSGTGGGVSNGAVGGVAYGIMNGMAVGGQGIVNGTASIGMNGIAPGTQGVMDTAGKVSGTKASGMMTENVSSASASANEPSAAGFTGSTYKDAVAYAKSNGVSGDIAAGILTVNEWNRKRQAYSVTGKASAEIKAADTYEDYLRFYTNYLVNHYG